MVLSRRGGHRGRRGSPAQTTASSCVHLPRSRQGQHAYLGHPGGLVKHIVGQATDGTAQRGVSQSASAGVHKCVCWSHVHFLLLLDLHLRKQGQCELQRAWLHIHSCLAF